MPIKTDNCQQDDAEIQFSNWHGSDFRLFGCDFWRKVYDIVELGVFMRFDGHLCTSARNDPI